MTESQQQARAILDRLAFMPFEQCLAIDRQFDHLPACPGGYAIRHQSEGVLYLGKTNNLGTRFNGRHKAFTWAWLVVAIVIVMSDTSAITNLAAINQLKLLPLL